jgi:hypothetical protein
MKDQSHLSSLDRARAIGSWKADSQLSPDGRSNENVLARCMTALGGRAIPPRLREVACDALERAEGMT